MSGVAGMPLPDGHPDLKPCGTLAAYRRHLRDGLRGPQIDRACRQASLRSWEDRIADGYTRPPRGGQRTVHVAGAAGKALCGKRPRNATGDPAGATCRGCLAVLERHLAKLPEDRFAAALDRQAAARGQRRAA